MGSVKGVPKRRVFWCLVLFLVLFGTASWAQSVTKDILVIEGRNDNIENVLAALGFGARIDTVPADNSLMNVDFGRYKALFINCSYGSITDRPGEDLLDKVKTFVQGGGMLYVTDDSANFLKSWDAEMGYDIAYDRHSFRSGIWKTDVPDAALRAKFPAERFDADGSIVIYRSSDNGEPILDPGRATVLLRNSANPGPSNAEPFQVQAIDFRPYGSNGGRVVYTTFHNHNNPP